MKTKTLYRYIAVLALASTVLIGGMLAISFTHGGTTAQDFETFAEPEAYTRDITHAEAPLRAIITFDDLFLVTYTATFVMLAIGLKDKENSLLVAIALGALLVTTYLDIQENNDLITFLNMAKAGITPTVDMLHSRAGLSSIKFFSSYLSFFLFAFVLPQKTTLEKFLRWSLWVGFLPLGVLVYTYPHPLFSLGRFLFMFAGLAMLSWIFYLRSKK
jgi:hypothetical protein